MQCHGTAPEVQDLRALEQALSDTSRGRKLCLVCPVLGLLCSCPVCGPEFVCHAQLRQASPGAATCCLIGSVSFGWLTSECRPDIVWHAQQCTFLGLHVCNLSLTPTLFSVRAKEMAGADWQTQIQNPNAVNESGSVAIRRATLWLLVDCPEPFICNQQCRLLQALCWPSAPAYIIASKATPARGRDVLSGVSLPWAQNKSLLESRTLNATF